MAKEENKNKGVMANLQSREETLTDLSRNTDPRHERPEFRAIITAAEDSNGEGVTIKELLSAVNAKYPCNPPLLTDKQLRSHMEMLVLNGVFLPSKQFQILNRRYTLNPKYVTKRVEYLPVSTYCIALFFIFVLAFAGSVIINRYIMESLAALVIGFMFIVAQHFGSEFTLVKRE